jgi:sugar phosphate isomerase/epimerase
MNLMTAMKKTFCVRRLMGRLGSLLAGAALLSGCAHLQPQPSNSEFFVFDNGVGRGKWTPDEQAATLKALGYDGISYDYTNNKDLAEWQKACKAHGVKISALYFYSYPDRPQRYDPELKEAIKMLKGSDTIIWMTLEAPKIKGDHDAEAIDTIREVAGLAAAQGLRVAIYPHRNFYISTAVDALRITKLVDRPNVGITLNLCHEFFTGNGGKLDKTIKAVAPYCMLVSINGMDLANQDYILPLDQGDFDVAGYVKKLHAAGFHGPIGLQCYQDIRENLRANMKAWKKISSQ